MANAEAPSHPDPSPRGWLFLTLALACLALAAWLRFWALDFGLPHPMTRPDEKPVLDLTALAARGTLEFDWANYPHAYVYLHWLWGELALRVGSLLGLTASGDYFATWWDDTPLLYTIGRGLTAGVGVLSVGVVMVAARRSLGSVAALLAGSWLAVCLLHVRDSHALKPDVLLALAVQLCIMASVRLAESPSVRRAAVAGLTVGFAAAAKYNGVLTAVPVVAASWIGTRGRALRERLAPLGVAGLASAIFFAATSPFLLTNEVSQQMLAGNLHAVFPAWFEAPPDGLRGSLDELDLPEPPDWAQHYGVLSGFLYHPTFSLRYGVGLAATALLPFALVWGLFSRILLTQLSSLFVIVWFGVVSVSPVLLSRYLTPALLPIAVLEAGVVIAALRRFAPARVHELAVIAGLLLCAEPLFGSIQLDRLLAQKDSRVRASEWLAVHARPGERALIVGTRFWSWGEPTLPPRVRRVTMGPRLVIHPQVADWVVAHDHELFWSDADRALLERSLPWLERRADFDPNEPNGPQPIFERNDAWYVPISGFQGVRFPGPRVEIFRVRPREPQPDPGGAPPRPAGGGR